jgi:hypothetical protein
VKRARAPLPTHLAVQLALWGAAELLTAALAWGRLAPRDLARYTELDRTLWLNAGLDAGVTAVGLTLAAVGWYADRRLPLVGAGIGVAVQGLALLVMHVTFISVLARLA